VNDLALDELTRLVQVVVDDRGRIDADTVINRRQDIERMDGVLDRRRRGLVRFSVDESALDPGAGDAARVAIGPMIAAVIVVLVARSADSPLRTAAKFPDRHNQRLAEQPALVKIGDQRRKPRVE
jgi:hypothetical protein